MKYENYYETLTKMQKLKWEEKKGPIIYKDWYEMISKNLDLETSGAFFCCLKKDNTQDNTYDKSIDFWK